MSRIFSIYRNKLIIYGSKTTQPSQNAILSLIKNQLGVRRIVEDSSTSKVYLNKKGELIVNSIEYRLDTDLGTPLYTFGLLSDTHIDGDGDDYGNSINDLKKAIKFFNDEGCEFIAYCGDMTYDGRSKDFTALKSCLNTSTIPNYTIRGNHDAYATNNGYLEATGKTEENYTIAKGNDLFIFMGHAIGSEEEMTDSQITWLTDLFNSNKDKRIFFFYHIPFRGTSGDGGGGAYPWYMLGDSTTTQSTALRNLLENNSNVIFMHGHSHMKFSLGDEYPNANHYHEEGKWYDIHVPSCARPRTPTSGGGVINHTEGSEGYLVEVYADKVLFKPIDFIANEYLLQYAYTVEL